MNPASCMSAHHMHSRWLWKQMGDMGSPESGIAVVSNHVDVFNPPGQSERTAVLLTILVFFKNFTHCFIVLIECIIL